MILLKYAKIWDESIDYTKIKLTEELKLILYRRTKEFVVCGYNIDAKDAIEMNEDERACLYLMRSEFLKEQKEDKEISYDWKLPATEDDMIGAYLTDTAVRYGF